MYELIQLSEHDFYIDCPAKIGLVKTDVNEVVLIDSGNDKDCLLYTSKKPSSGGGGMQKQLQQMQAMQRKMEMLQAEIEEKEVTATAGGGAVSATINGKKEIVRLELQPEIVDPEDIEMLQDLIMAAVNEGIRQIDEISNTEMSKLTGGLGIPGL